MTTDRNVYPTQILVPWHCASAPLREACLVSVAKEMPYAEKRGAEKRGGVHLTAQDKIKMKITTTFGVLIAFVILVSGCTTQAVVDKPFDEVKRQIQGMWRPQTQAQAIVLPFIDNNEVPPHVRDDPKPGDIHGRPGWLYDSVQRMEGKDKITYEVQHHFETSGLALPWARTSIVLRRLKNDKTNVSISAEDIGLVFDKRNRSREKWVLDHLVPQTRPQ